MIPKPWLLSESQSRKYAKRLLIILIKADQKLMTVQRKMIKNKRKAKQNFV